MKPRLDALHSSRRRRCSPPLLSIASTPSAPWVPNRRVGVGRRGRRRRGTRASSPRASSCPRAARRCRWLARASSSKHSGCGGGRRGGDGAVKALHGGLRGSSSDPSSLPFTTRPAPSARRSAYSSAGALGMVHGAACACKTASAAPREDGLGAVEHDSAAPAAAAADGWTTIWARRTTASRSTRPVHDRQFDDRLLRTVRAPRAQFGAQFSCAILVGPPRRCDRCPQGGSAHASAPPSRSGAPPHSADRDTALRRCLQTSRPPRSAAGESCLFTSRKSAGSRAARATPLAERALADRARRGAAPLGGTSSPGSSRGWEAAAARRADPRRLAQLDADRSIHLRCTFFALRPATASTHLSSLHASWCACRWMQRARAKNRERDAALAGSGQTEAVVAKDRASGDAARKT